MLYWVRVICVGYAIQLDVTVIFVAVVAPLHDIISMVVVGGSLLCILR